MDSASTLPATGEMTIVRVANPSVHLVRGQSDICTSSPTAVRGGDSEIPELSLLHASRLLHYQTG